MSEAPPNSELPISRRPRFRRLRIAVSAFFGVLTLLLVVLWVRSYLFDGLDVRCFPISTSKVLSLGTVNGHLTAAIRKPVTASKNFRGDIGAAQIKAEQVELLRLRYHFESEKPGMLQLLHDRIVVPIWLPLMVSSVLTLAPWYRRQFSLRSLLIATTLVAVVLGLAVWMVR